LLELRPVNAPPSGPAPADEKDSDDANSTPARTTVEQAHDRVSQAWEQIQMGFPKLMGAPAYWKPRRTFTPQDRPFDPDELPLEADRPEEGHETLGSADAPSPEAEPARLGEHARRRQEGDGRRGRRRCLPSRLFRSSPD
jgi:hypothetical protein